MSIGRSTSRFAVVIFFTLVAVVSGAATIRSGGSPRFGFIEAVEQFWGIRNTDNIKLFGAVRDLQSNTFSNAGTETAEPNTAQNFTATFAAALPQYRVVTSNGSWHLSSTWETSPDGTDPWSPATTPPTAANSDSILITDFVQIVNGGADVTADQLTIVGGNRITVNTPRTLTIANGPGTDLTVNGELKLSGGLYLMPAQ